MRDRDWYKNVEFVPEAPQELFQSRPVPREVEVLAKEAKRRGRPKSPPKIEKMYSVSHWASVLDYSAHALRDWIKSGKLDAHWIAGEYRITETQIRDFIQSQDKARA